MTKYHKLIVGDREKPSENPSRNLADEFTSDFSRILFSNQYRRLQQKAQVFPLEDNAAVRSRLTHSLEVCHLGRLIANKIRDKIPEDIGEGKYLSSFASIVANACAIHDIGNPPFGHFGEKAIKDWFNKNGINNWIQYTEKFVDVSARHDCLTILKDKYRYDFDYFDGNAQGLRILTKLQWSRDQYSYNLTYSTLAAFLKYVRACDDKANKHGYEKRGYFVSEADLINAAWKVLDLKEGQRYPLSYIMEAADDIAYCLSDIDDGLEKRIVRINRLRRKLKEFIDTMFNGEINEFELLVDGISDYSTYFDFKVKYTNWLVEYCAEQYVEKHDPILAGDYEGKLIDKTSQQYKSLKVLKTFTRKFIFTSVEAENIELGGYSIIKGLLNYFSMIFEYDRVTFVKSISNARFTDAEIQEFCDGIIPPEEKIETDDLLKRVVNKMPAKFMKAYLYKVSKLKWEETTSNAEELFYRTHLLVDYISGMTDKHALETFQLLEGITVE
jgi:dGTPase